MSHGAASLDLEGLCVSRLTGANVEALVDLFRRVGAAELRFLVNSGATVGLCLGACQAAASLFLPRRWGGAGANATAEPERPAVALVGSGVVGCVTNWVALLWIFRPVDPIQLLGGRVVLQGCFLRRQPQVAADFAAFFTSRILTARLLVDDALFSGARAHVFRPRLRARVATFLRAGERGLVPSRLRGLSRNGAFLDAATAEIAAKLPAALPDGLYAYADAALDLERTLTAEMAAMEPRAFERLLHPIFEEDEGTLIAVGGALGVAAAWAQLAAGATTAAYVRRLWTRAAACLSRRWPRRSDPPRGVTKA